MTSYCPELEEEFLASPCLGDAPLGLGEYEPQVEPQYVWVTGQVWIAHLTRECVCFLSELGAWRQRERNAKDPSLTIVSDSGAPERTSLSDALAWVSAFGRSVLILADDDGKEVRRWKL